MNEKELKNNYWINEVDANDKPSLQSTVVNSGVWEFLLQSTHSNGVIFFITTLSDIPWIYVFDFWLFENASDPGSLTSLFLFLFHFDILVALKPCEVYVNIRKGCQSKFNIRRIIHSQ